MGRIINVGRLGGFSGDFDFDLHAARRIQYIGVTFRTRSIDEIRAITKAVQEDLGRDLGDGKLALPIDSSFDIEDVNDALARMKANEHFWKNHPYIELDRHNNITRAIKTIQVFRKLARLCLTF